MDSSEIVCARLVAEEDALSTVGGTLVKEDTRLARVGETLSMAVVILTTGGKILVVRTEAVEMTVLGWAPPAPVRAPEGYWEAISEDAALVGAATIMISVAELDEMISMEIMIPGFGVK